VFWWKGSQLPATLDVLANDHDPDGNPIHVVSVTAGSMGSATILPDGRLRYMWSSPKEGTDHFTYTIADSFGATATANVTIQIIDP
jgi:hypothetical protein